MKKFIHTVLTVVGCNAAALGQVQFTDVTEGSGIDFYEGKSFGVSWGDLTGNGLPDLYSSGHFNFFTMHSPIEFPYVFVNLGAGEFSHEIYPVDPDSTWDLHGALIFDHNNNGVNDMLCLSGGTHANLFYINTGETDFIQQNVAEQYNIDQEFGRGRMAGCLDINRDGITDIILNNEANSDNSAPPSLYLGQENGTFSEASAAHNFDLPFSEFSTLYDMNNDGEADLIVLTDGVHIYDISTESLDEQLFQSVSNASDLAVGDVDGDLLPDIFVARGLQSPEIILFSSTEIRSVLRHSASTPAYEFSFFTTGPITVNIKPRAGAYNAGVVHAGSFGSFNVNASSHSFDINPNSGGFLGVPDFDPAAETWQVVCGRDASGRIIFRTDNLFNADGISVTVTGSSEFTEFETLPLNPPVLPDRLFKNNGNFSFTETEDPGISAEDNSFSAVMADFDNDMDLDIYVQVSGSAANRPNYLLENLGDGTFERHDGAWGASGDGPGIGEAVSVADYDNDGFIDILTTNGSAIFYLDGARYNLYKNSGNSNNWLKLVLTGTVAPRGAYGAVAYLYADGKAQMRTQNAGEHTRTQDDSRLHFGLAQNEAADSLIIQWPCGTVQKMFNVEANQILEITEPECETVSTAEPDENIDFKVYPNPAESVFFIECDHPQAGMIRLTNVLGQAVGTYQLNPSGRSTFRTPDTPGSYSISILNKDGRVLGVQRLIVK